MANRKVVAILAAALLIPLTGSLLASAAVTISATDPAGDVQVVSLGGLIPPEVVNAVDLTSAQITFTESSVTATYEMAGQVPSNFTIGNYSIYVYAIIMGQYSGQGASLILGAGFSPQYGLFGQAFAALVDSNGNPIAIFGNESVSVQVSGSAVTVTAPVGTSTFTPGLGNSTNPSSVESGAIIEGTMTGGAFDEINLYEAGSISGGGVTTPPSGTTTTTQTTTTTTEEVSNPLEQEPTTNDVVVSLEPPTKAHITIDSTKNLVSIDLEGTGSTSGAPPDHVGIAVIALLKDGNVSYAWFNGEGDWDDDNNPANGYVFTMQYMGYSIDLKVTPTGPADNPWATFSYSFKGTVPADYLEVSYGMAQVDKFGVLARAYLDRDETTWNQAWVWFTPTTGGGEVTTTTTTPQEGGGQSTTTTGGAQPGGGAGAGLDPVIIGGIAAAVIIGVVAALLIKRR